MVEEIPVVQNKRPLIVAVALGLAAVLLYNIQVHRIRNEVQGASVKIVRYTADLAPGQKLKEDDLDVIELPEPIVKMLGRIVKPNEIGELKKYGVNRQVAKDQLAMWEHVTGRDGAGRVIPLNSGEVATTLEVDATKVPGNLLFQGDRVNILGVFSVNEGSMKTYRIVEGVVVLTIGGQAKTASNSRGLSGQRTYRQITVRLAEDVSLKLHNVLTWNLADKALIEMCGPPQPNKTYGQINPELRVRAETANPEIGRESDDSSGI